jgi:hypothetical protein
MKSVIARITPNNDKAVLFFPETKKDGQITCFLEGAERRVGVDFYQATHALNKEDAFKIAQSYAQHANIPPEEIVVRQRLPKSFNTRGRKTNDVSATNLTLVKNEEKGETLQQMAQELHDNATKHDTKQEKAPEENKNAAKVATASNPEGAVVHPRQKRKYERKENKRSAAALRRYQEELAKTAAASPSIMEPVKAGPGVTQTEIDDATMKLALQLARILKQNPGIL